MIISEKTRDLIFDIREYSKNTLSDFNDVSVLIENLFYTDKRREFLGLIFKAKFLYGMMSIFQNEAKDESAKEKISGEFEFQLTSFIKQFQSLTEEFELNDKELFAKKYFQLNPDSLANCINFIKDLSICKNFFLDNPELLK